MAPGFEDEETLRRSKTATDYWAHGPGARTGEAAE
jgi:hypothetical protein